MSWKKVNLGDILTESKIISENPNPDRRITVRLKVLGVEKRGLENEVEGATKQYIRKAGQFIYGKQNFHKGAFGIVPPELDGFESSSDLPAFDVDKSCLPEFIFYFFKQGNFYLELSKIASGVATQRINTTQLFELELLLPDIKTQRHLISNIQLLEKNGSEVSTELTHQLTLVKKLRQQLLQDAVQGKLVEQNKKEEPARELLKKIKAEKEKLIAEKKLKKEKELPPIKPEEIPFEIPENWVWCRLGEITSDVSYGTSEKSDLVGEIPVLRMGNITSDGEICYSNLKYVSSKISDLPKLYLQNGDLIFNRTNSYELVGKSGVFENLEQYTLASYLIRVRFFYPINSKFLANYINSKVCRETQLEPQIIQQNGQANFNGTKLSNIIVPLPPITEQNRIIQKLELLKQHCNELEVSIKQSESQNEKLLQQVLREALRKEPVGV